MAAHRRPRPLDDHGYLYLLDRAKDLIITGGSNVYAIEVEAALVAIPPSATWPSSVCPIAPGASWWWRSSSVTRSPKRRWPRTAPRPLAAYKRPRRYVFVDALPRNAYGKVLKRELRDRFS